MNKTKKKKERKKYIFTQKTYKTTLTCYYRSRTPFNEHESINLIGLRLCYGRGEVICIDFVCKYRYGSNSINTEDM